MTRRNPQPPARERDLSVPLPREDLPLQCEDCKLKGLRLCMYHGYPYDTIPTICDYRIVDVDRDEYCIKQLRMKER